MAKKKPKNTFIEIDYETSATPTRPAQHQRDQRNTNEQCEVVKIAKYKKGNKIHLVHHYKKQNSTGFGIWQNDYPHLIEIV